MPGAFYGGAQFAGDHTDTVSSLPALEIVSPTPHRSNTVTTTTTMTAPLTISSRDESVSVIEMTSSEDGSLIDMPAPVVVADDTPVASAVLTVVPETVAATSTAAFVTPPSSVGGGDDDGFIVVYDSASEDH